MRGAFALLPHVGMLVACAGAPDMAPVDRAAAKPGVERSIAPRWTRKVGRWNQGVAVASGGEALAIDGRTLRVHGARDGSIVRSAPVCHPVSPDGLRFVGPRKLFVACDDGWVTFSWPGLAMTPGPRVRLNHAAIGPALVASVTGHRRVRIWTTERFDLVDWFDVPGEVSALAVSARGHTLAIATDQGIIVRDVVAQTNRVIHAVGPGGHAGIRAMAFSPDDKRLFAGTVELEVATGGILRSVAIDAWVTAIRYLSADVVVATGARGLHLVDSREGPPKMLDARLDEGLDVAPDGSSICAGSRDGNMACFEARGYALRTARPVGPAPRPESAPPREPAESLVDGPRAAKPTSGAPEGSNLAWSMYQHTATRTLVLARTGELLTAQGGMVDVHTAADGRVTGKISLCSSALEQLAFIDERRLFYLCDYEAGIASFPAVKILTKHRVEGFSSATTPARGRIALEAVMGKSIAVRTVAEWNKVDDFPIDARLVSFALSPDGTKLAYALYDRGIVLRDLATRKETSLATDVTGDGLAFSPDGARLFSLGKPFQAVELDIATLTQKRAWSANTYVTKALYLGRDTIVVAGAGGLTLFGGKGGMPPPSVAPYDMGLAVGADEATFCASGPKGELACFRRSDAPAK